MSIETIGVKLRKLRTDNKFPLRKVAALIDIDVAILSKMERGERRLTKEVVQKLAKIYKHNADELLVLYLSEKVIYEIGNEELALKALMVAEEQVAYYAKPAADKSSIIKSVKTFFKKDGRIKTAWLFGSFARGEQKFHSDVDIMIELNKAKKYSMFDIIDISYLLGKKINKKVDLVEKGCLKDFAMKTAKKDMLKIYG